MNTKRCTKCGEEKPATREFFGSTRAGNLRGTCRTCMNGAASSTPKTTESVRRRARERQARANKWKPSDKLKHELFRAKRPLWSLRKGTGWSDPRVLQVEQSSAAEPTTARTWFGSPHLTKKRPAKPGHLCHGRMRHELVHLIGKEVQVTGHVSSRKTGHHGEWHLREQMQDHAWDRFKTYPQNIRRNLTPRPTTCGRSLS